MKRQGKLNLSPEEYDKQLEEHIRRHYEDTPVQYDERKTLCESIEKTFFNGSMAFKWHELIDYLIDYEDLNTKQIYYIFSASYYKKTRKQSFSDCTEKWLQPSINKVKRLKILQ